MKRLQVLHLCLLFVGANLIAGSVLTNWVQAASVAINFQTDRAGYGPNSVSAETPAEAFGVPAVNWYEPGSVPAGSTNFATGGGSVDIEWDSYPDAAPGVAYGWTHANQPGVPSPPGDPLTGEDAVFVGFLFGLSEAEGGGPGGHPITVSISSLGNIADLSAGYTVRLLASSEWPVDAFTDASVEDNASNSESVSFSQVADHPLWWTGPPYASAGAIGVSTANLFTGDTLTITLDGPNQVGNIDVNDPESSVEQRTSLAGVIIDYTPVPEPYSLVLAVCGIASVGLFSLRRRSNY